jgi:hypothetical protein
MERILEERIDALIRGRRHVDNPKDPSSGLISSVTLKPHQIEGVRWLVECFL